MEKFQWALIWCALFCASVLADHTRKKAYCDDVYKKCENGGKCGGSGHERVCECLAGTSGDFCGTVDECDQLLCGRGNDVVCLYDPSKAAAICVCKNNRLSFDRVDRKCRAPCVVNEDCENSAPCLRKGAFDQTDFMPDPDDLKYCRCYPDTSGDTCATVHACAEERKLCGEGDDVECAFDAETKAAKCTCLNHTHDFDYEQKICKECDCGPNSTRCSWKGGVKVCDCADGYYDNGGTCTGCACGPKSSGCSVQDGKKTCHCSKDFKQKGDTCEYCSCRRHWTDCNFEGEEMKCTCEQHYAQKDDVCVDACLKDEECKNGGSCTNNICQCKKGTGGAFCQIVTSCEYDNPCPSNIPCEYDQDTEQAVCKCPEHYVYFEEQRKCIGSCNEEDRKCLNGGSCSKNFSADILICDCLPGTSGDMCERVDKCDKGPKQYQLCGPAKGKTCTYDPVAKEPVCGCQSDTQKFILQEKKCKTTCDSSQRECKYGGSCEKRDEGEFCACAEGFSGDLCQTVKECVGDNPLCGFSDEVSCYYDETNSKAECNCKEQGKKYDKLTDQCRDPCDQDDDCSYGQKCVERAFGNFCDCGSGLEGDKCEIIRSCKNGLCGDGADVDCKFDPKAPQNAACVCKDGAKKFDPKMKICRATCGEGNPSNETCRYNILCEGGTFCRCKEGQLGDFCETLECSKCGNATGVVCGYNETREAVSCGCEESWKSFDHIDKQCRTPCNLSMECQNTANCMKGSFFAEQPEDRRFCRCYEGSSGDRCEVVDDCQIEGKVDCGKEKNETLCLFSRYQKTGYCGCKDPDKRFNDKTKRCMECDCGERSFRCDYDDGIKNCGCEDGSYAKDGFCTDCGCGAQSKGCRYRESTEEITCQCAPGFSQNRTYCEACYCGSRSKECSFSKGKIMCHCEPGYVQRDDYCQPECNATSPCQHGGECQDGLCFCRRGTAGAFCQIVVDCSNNEICGRENDVLCLYDEKKEGAYCACNNSHHMFDDRTKQCIECDCGNKGACALEEGKKTCICIEKYGEKQGKCTECNCGEEATGCTFIGKQVQCACVKGFANRNGNCSECDCGDHGDCSFRKDKKTCSCDRDFALYNGTCVACECGEHVDSCDFKGDDVTCGCKGGFVAFEGSCKECDCGAKGTCSFDKEGKKVCDCSAGHAEKDGTCVEVCRDDCVNGGECKKEEKYRFCSCLPGTSGDLCKTVDDCQSTFRDCKGPMGSCKYNITSQAAYCFCSENTHYDPQLRRCRMSCSVDADCKNGGKCVEGRCACAEGTSGDTCDTVDGCAALEEECKLGHRRCEYAPHALPHRAECVCQLEQFEFNEQTNKCVPVWCLENPCAADAYCQFDLATKTAYCACNDKAAYYNNTAKACLAVDACLFTSDCQKFEVCEAGVCKCRPFHQKTEDGCKPKLCQNHLCYYIKNAVCTETDVLGAVKCDCQSNYFFNGAECTYGACLLPDQWKSCYVDCPDGMHKTDTGCQAEDEKLLCDKKCGKYGWCIKEGGKEVCKCLQKDALLKNGVCVLDASSVCASKKLSNDSSKCECSGMYKYAEDGITCQLRSCSDEDVQAECKRVGAAECKDGWNPAEKVGFECLCGPGYSKNDDKICTEKCRLESHVAACASLGQTCFQDDLFNANCRCPPTFSWNALTRRCDTLNENSFMIHNLSIAKRRYVRKNAPLDTALLNAHIVSAMKNVYQKKVLDYAYLFDFTESGEELNCSVVLQLKDSSKFDLHRYRFYSSINLTCDDCSLLPPLVLKKNAFQEIGIERLSLCSSSLKQYLCGTGTECGERKCSCSEGYRPIVPTIQKTDDYTVMRCEDVDECSEGVDTCSGNTTCVNTPGDFYCKCKPGYKKSSDALPYKNTHDKEHCVDLCTPNPCSKGSCRMKEKVFDCSCDLGYSGSLCEAEDASLKKANNNSKIIGGVLGAFLAVTVLAFILYVLKVKRDRSDSDYVPATNRAAEMHERRGVQGTSNHGYE